MNNNAWFKKENPLLSLHSMGGGAAGTLMQGEATKTYVDEVFSSYTDIGTGNARTIVNNIDLSTKGGLVWQKWRNGGASSNENNTSHILADTVRGTSKYLKANASDSEFSVSAVGAFNSNGYQTGGNLTSTDNSNDQYVGWTFAKQKGFFDIVTYTGDSNTNQTISHSLGSIPGCIIIKSTSTVDNWTVYHRGAGQDKRLYLNETDAASSSGSPDWSNISSTSFEALGATSSNENGETYVAYLFAGGASDAGTARSVILDGSDDYYQAGTGTDYTFGTGDFTIEGWFKLDSTSNSGLLMQHSSPGLGTSYEIAVLTDTVLKFKAGGTEYTTTYTTPIKQWFHIALVRSSGSTSFYVNGILQMKVSDTTSYSGTDFIIGGYWSESYLITGSISNFRIVKGTAVYTSSFIPPTEPLTSITNTVLLFCQNSTSNGTTTGTVGQNSPPTVSTNSPFDDPNGFKFGEDSDKNIIKCGSYAGTSLENKITLPFEPQWLLIKVYSRTEGWVMFDIMRGIATDKDSKYLEANHYSNENNFSNYIDIDPDGFTVKGSHNSINADGESYTYIAIRRPDGYVGKPPEAASEVFAMDTGNASTTIPVWDSNFVVDFAMNRAPASTTSWYTSARLIQDYYLLANGTNYENQDDGAFFDSNVGWAKDGYGTWGSTYQSWMWKRYPKGFDVVTYESPGGNDFEVRHNLGVVPEMMWIKRMTNDSGAYNWTVYHKGLNGGTNPENYGLHLNTNSEEVDDYGFFSDTAPNATAFHVGYDGTTGASGKEYLAMLFASVEGICKVGYYDGSNSEQTITTGFQPKYCVIKKADTAQGWVVLDTLRGWASGVDERLEFHNNSAQSDSIDFGAPTATGFTLTGNVEKANQSGARYIYYAHA